MAKGQRKYKKVHNLKADDGFVFRVSEQRNKVKAWFRRYKSSCKCSKCGENHPACLQFHHRDPEQKLANISFAVRNWSLKKLKEEIAKCDVLCSNCHLKFHWDEPKKKINNCKRNCKKKKRIRKKSRKRVRK